MKKLLISMVIVVLSGCAKNTMDVKPISYSYEITHMCIGNNSKVRVGSFEGIIIDGFQNHGITTEVYTGEPPEHCEYKLTYTALRSYIDWRPQLTHAEVRLFKDNKRIGYADYYMARKYAWFSYANGYIKRKNGTSHSRTIEKPLI